MAWAYEHASTSTVMWIKIIVIKWDIYHMLHTYLGSDILQCILRSTWFYSCSTDRRLHFLQVCSVSIDHKGCVWFLIKRAALEFSLAPLSRLLFFHGAHHPQIWYNIFGGGPSCLQLDTGSMTIVTMLVQCCTLPLQVPEQCLSHVDSQQMLNEWMSHPMRQGSISHILGVSNWNSSKSGNFPEYSGAGKWYGQQLDSSLTPEQSVLH